MQAERIVSIKKIGLVPCGDIEVQSKNHLFYGNGIATSNSHSYSYALNGYYCAWIKAHYPKVFFCSWLKNSDDKPHKQTEIMELINEAKLFDIEVVLPNFKSLNKRFDIIDNYIQFGLCDIRGFGDSLYTKLKQVIDDNCINVKNLSWYGFLTKIAGKINSAGVIALIKSGALPYNESRQKMLYEFLKWNELTTREQDFVKSTLATDLIDGLTFLVGSKVPNVKRKVIIQGLLSSLIQPPMSLEDSTTQNAIYESLYLGTPISCHIVDGYNLASNTVTCRNILDGQKGKMFLLAEIKSKHVHKIKKGKSAGKDMAFLTMEDGTGLLDSVVIFAEAFEKNSAKLIENSVVLLAGKSDNKQSFVVDDVWEA